MHLKKLALETDLHLSLLPIHRRSSPGLNPLGSPVVDHPRPITLLQHRHRRCSIWIHITRAQRFRYGRCRPLPWKTRSWIPANSLRYLSQIPQAQRSRPPMNRWETQAHPQSPRNWPRRISSKCTSCSQRLPPTTSLLMRRHSSTLLPTQRHSFEHSTAIDRARWPCQLWIRPCFSVSCVGTKQILTIGAHSFKR